MEQYHHKSKSQEQQRRESFAAAAQNPSPTVLAPIYNYPPGAGVTRDTAENDQSVEATDGSRADLVQEARVSQPALSQNKAQANSSSAEDQASISAATMEEANDTAGARYEPKPKEESPAHSDAHSPSDQLRMESQAAEPVQIKEEPFSSELNSTVGHSPSHEGRRSSLDKKDIDEETKKAIEKLRSDDLGLRGARDRNSDKIAQSIEGNGPTAAGPGPKKRPAPKTTAATKKGVAKKPPAKKRRTLQEKNAGDGPERDGPATGPRTKPNGHARSGVKSKSATPAPLDSSPSGQTYDEDEDDDDDDGSDGGSVYCICRKPDDHRWMIACDGCEDWFHGECVQMKSSDGELIFQYFCPACTEAGKGRTLWKPQCRRKGCGRVADLDANSKSTLR